ncbi:MAG: ribonuclease P protein component [Lentisphaeria bacterium]|nr:ribonuclease P protein component [Lentisphaeria bacterium]
MPQGRLRRHVLKKSLRKADKLKLKSDFEYVRNCGVKYVGKGFLTVVAPPNVENRVRCGVICSRKYSTLAVKRNRARRILFESFRLLKENIEPCVIVLIPRHNMMDYKQPQAMIELQKDLEKAGVWKLSD